MLTYREATPEDVPKIVRSRADDLNWGPADPRTGRYLEGDHHPSHALGPRTIFVCTVGDEVAGYIGGHLTRRYDCDGELQYLWVAPDHRRLGVASSLLRLLAEWFGALGALRVCVDVLPDNARARSFYKRHGAEDLNPHWLVWENITALSDPPSLGPDPP
ncbi:MAG: GNAT family N-acetyltransferase [Longimicrobiales bacterium]